MKGNCETCAKRKTCTKDIGIIFGFCNTDYEPVKAQKPENKQKKVDN